MSKASVAQGSASVGVTALAEVMTVAQNAAAAEDWEAARAVWVHHAHGGNTRAQAEIGRCFVDGWERCTRRRSCAQLLLAGKVGDPVTALAWLVRGHALRRKFVDRFYDGVRNSSTPEQRREAERPACLPIEAKETSP